MHQKYDECHSFVIAATVETWVTVWTAIASEPLALLVGCCQTIVPIVICLSSSYISSTCVEFSVIPPAYDSCDTVHCTWKYIDILKRCHNIKLVFYTYITLRTAGVTSVFHVILGDTRGGHHRSHFFGSRAEWRKAAVDTRKLAKIFPRAMTIFIWGHHGSFISNYLIPRRAAARRRPRRAGGGCLNTAPSNSAPGPCSDTR